MGMSGVLVIAGGISAVPVIIVTGMTGNSVASGFGVPCSSFMELCCTSAVHFEMLVFQSLRRLVGV